MKNNFLRLIAIVSVLFATVFIFSCASSDAAEEAPAVEQNNAANVSASVAENVIVSTDSSDWKENVFASADQHGYFFTTSEIGQFSMIEGEFKKSGGYEQSGFGFVFGYTADEEGWLADYMRFEINTAGQFTAYACRGNTYIDLVENSNRFTVLMVKKWLSWKTVVASVSSIWHQEPYAPLWTVSWNILIAMETNGTNGVPTAVGFLPTTSA